MGSKPNRVLVCRERVLPGPCERRLPSRRAVLGLAGALLVLPVLVLAARGQLPATSLTRSVKAAWDLEGRRIDT